MLKTKTPRKPKPLYRQKPPKRLGGDFVHAETISPAHFELREDGTIDVERRDEKRAPELVYRDDARGLWLYHGNCLELLDAIAAKYPEGRFDMIFADPPYFLSNGGISCHAGKMVKVNKGDWDVSRGPELNHEFNTEWLRRCQRVLKPNGTIWVSGTLHVIHSIGYAMQQLGFRIGRERRPRDNGRRHLLAQRLRQRHLSDQRSECRKNRIRLQCQDRSCERLFRSRVGIARNQPI